VPDKLHKTKGIVLRTVKYGETSLISGIFTRQFGLQSYLVNGVRTSTQKGSGKATLFQPSAILDLVVYHSEFRNLQRIKELRWQHIYRDILSHVKKNAVALFMVELLSKCLKQPEANPDLFDFVEDAFLHLDEAADTVVANYPLYFALHLPVFLGLRISPSPPYGVAREMESNFDYSADLYLDLMEGTFVGKLPVHPHFIAGKEAVVTSEILKVMQPEELKEMKMNHDLRKDILLACEKYYALHIQDFGSLKTLPVLREVLR
jgi:DNA repair protein RecO (recombination protein O)